MRKIFTLVSLILVLDYLPAQITVTENDFANAGDKVIMSNATINQLLDYQANGPNTNWNFSNLQYSSQYTDNFLNELSVLDYALYFSDISFNSHRANIAEDGANPAPILPILPLTITNTVNYFYKNSSEYVQQGYGADINSIPLPIGYNNPDVIYTFPMEYENTGSSASGYSIDLPGTGYYAYQQTRTNTVDGWGTLTTPYGAFQVLRLVSEITSDDSFYVTALSLGFKLPRLTQKEYKWIGNGQQEPLLQINTEVLISNLIEDVTSIVYRDSIHPVVVIASAITGPPVSAPGLIVYPNPARNQFTIYAQSGLEHASLEVRDVTGRTIMSKELGGNEETIESGGWERGIYFISISQSGQRIVRRVVLQ